MDGRVGKTIELFHNRSSDPKGGWTHNQKSAPGTIIPMLIIALMVVMMIYSATNFPSFKKNILRFMTT